MMMVNYYDVDSMIFIYDSVDTLKKTVKRFSIFQLSSSPCSASTSSDRQVSEFEQNCEIQKSLVGLNLHLSHRQSLLIENE